MRMGPTDRLVRPEDLARELGVSWVTVRVWYLAGRIPRPSHPLLGGRGKTRAGRAYTEEEAEWIRGWWEGHRVSSHVEGGRKGGMKRLGKKLGRGVVVEVPEGLLGKVEKWQRQDREATARRLRNLEMQQKRLQQGDDAVAGVAVPKAGRRGRPKRVVEGGFDGGEDTVGGPTGDQGVTGGD